MPTLVRVEGMEHQVASTNGGATGLWGQIVTASSISFDTTIKHTGLASLKVVESGAAACGIYPIIAASQNVIVGSMYIYMDANPSVNSRIMCSFVTAGVGATLCDVTTAGVIRMQCGDGTVQSSGITVTDAAWHRLDWYSDISGATKTVKWTVDGVAQTDATSTTNTATAYNTANPALGSNISTHTATCWYDCLLLSHIAADYPIGVADGYDHYKVLGFLPDGAGTDNNPSSYLQDEAGNAPLFSDINEWPSEATDYIRQITLESTHYAEFTLEDTTETTIWDVQGVLAYTSEATQANNGTTRIVLSDGTTVEDIFSGDMSDGSTTNHFYKSNLLTRPAGGWTQTNFNGSKVRIGFATDATPDPYWLGVLLQVAVPVSADTLFAQALF